MPLEALDFDMLIAYADIIRIHLHICGRFRICARIIRNPYARKARGNCPSLVYYDEQLYLCQYV